MPKVDDCITLLMHTDEKFHYNLKEVGHFYLTENRDLMSIEQMEQDLVLKYGERRAKRVMKVWFDAYKSVDIVDTGVYDCYSKEYVERAKRESAIINVPYQYVPGSNIILEKLVSGKWDDQFLIIEKGGVDRRRFWNDKQRVIAYNILIILNIMCCRIMRISTNWK